MFRAIMPGYFFDRAKGLERAAQLTQVSSDFRVADAVWENLNKGYDLRADLQKIVRPVLIVQGHQDPIGDKTAEQIHGLIRSSKLHYIRQCGHFPWIEQPEEFKSILTEFLSLSDRLSAKLEQPRE